MICHLKFGADDDVLFHYMFEVQEKPTRFKMVNYIVFKSLVGKG